MLKWGTVFVGDDNYYPCQFLRGNYPAMRRDSRDVSRYETHLDRVSHPFVLPHCFCLVRFRQGGWTRLGGFEEI